MQLQMQGSSRLVVHADLNVPWARGQGYSAKVGRRAVRRRAERGDRMLACSRDCKQWCGQGTRHWSCRAHERELWDEGCSGCVLQCVSVCLSITEIQAVAANTPAFYLLVV